MLVCPHQQSKVPLLSSFEDSSVLYNSSQIDKASKDDLFFIASKFEKRIQRALIDAFNKIRNQKTIDEIANAFQRGGITAVQSLFATIPGIIEAALIPEITLAVLESGRAMLGYMPNGSFLEPFNFSIIDPNTSSRLRIHNSALVQEISVNTQRAITQRMNANVVAGVNPKNAARDLKGIIGLTDYQEQTVRNFEQGLRELDSKILERKLIDGRQLPSIERAIDDASPLPEDRIQQIVKRYSERMLKLRTQTIARTESLRATAMGEHYSLQQAQDQGKLNREVTRFWIATNDGRTRNSHILAPSMNEKGRAINEPFQTVLGNLMFPRDPNGHPANVINCRCRLIYRLGNRKSPKPQFERKKK